MSLLLGILVGATIGVIASWAWVRAAIGAARIQHADLLDERLDQQAVQHHLQLEAVRRGADIVAADENAWQLLQRMRSAMPEGARVLRLERTRTVRASQQ